MFLGQNLKVKMRKSRKTNCHCRYKREGKI